MPGGGKSKKWWNIYEKMRANGHTQESAAKLTNSIMKKTQPGKRRFKK